MGFLLLGFAERLTGGVWVWIRRSRGARNEVRVGGGGAQAADFGVHCSCLVLPLDSRLDSNEMAQGFKAKAPVKNLQKTKSTTTKKVQPKDTKKGGKSSFFSACSRRSS